MLSAIEGIPAQVISLFLVVKNKLPNRIRQLLALPLTFLSSGCILLAVANGFPDSPDGVSCCAKFMGRNVSYGYGLSGCQGRKPGGLGHSFRGSVSHKSRFVRLFHRNLSPDPGPCQVDGLSWSLIVHIDLLKQVQYMLGADSRPQGEQLMIGIG